MITSIHTLIYSDDANATRAFLRDVLGWEYVTEDFDHDWLIFKSGPSEMGVHPTHSEWEGQTYDHPRHHLIAVMCDNIEATGADLQAKGAEFRGAIEQREYGRVVMMAVPGAARGCGFVFTVLRMVIGPSRAIPGVGDASAYFTVVGQMRRHG